MEGDEEEKRCEIGWRRRGGEALETATARS